MEQKRGVEPFAREIDSIDFQTANKWSANDLSVCLASIDEVYLAFLLARHLAVEVQRTVERLAEESAEFLREVEGLGPPGDIFLYEWIRLIRRLGPRALRFPLPFAGYAQAQAPGLSWTSIERYLTNPSLFIDPADELLIGRVEMASPGGFTLKGLGEPLREIRELIKDVWYRNRQERHRGELELIKQKLQLITQYRLSEPIIEELSVVVLKDVTDVKPLVESGKLAIADADREPAPTPKGSVTRRRPRRPNTGT